MAKTGSLEQILFNRSIARNPLFASMVPKLLGLGTPPINPPTPPLGGTLVTPKVEVDPILPKTPPVPEVKLQGTPIEEDRGQTLIDPDTPEQSGLITQGDVEKPIKIPKGVRNYLEDAYGEVNPNDAIGENVRRILRDGISTEEDKKFLSSDIIATDISGGGLIEAGIEDAYDDPKTKARLKRQLKSLKDFQKVLNK